MLYTLTGHCSIDLVKLFAKLDGLRPLPDASRQCWCRYGYKGFYNRKQKPVVLNSKAVEGIQLQGGTILGTSRGGADIK